MQVPGVMLESPLVKTVLGLAVNVHRELGPGLLESAYRTCLVHELVAANLVVSAEVPLPIVYKAVRLDCGYRLDVVVENQLLLEIKSIERVMPVHRAQILTYLKLARIKQGILLNFNVYRLKDGMQSFLM